MLCLSIARRALDVGSSAAAGSMRVWWQAKSDGTRVKVPREKSRRLFVGTAPPRPAPRGGKCGVSGGPSRPFLRDLSAD